MAEDKILEDRAEEREGTSLAAEREREKERREWGDRRTWAIILGICAAWIVWGLILFSMVRETIYPY